MFDYDHSEAAKAEIDQLIAALARLTRLWRMSCGASNGAFRVLQIACLGTGSLHAEELFRFDKDNRIAALIVLGLAPVLGTDGMPITAELRAALERESNRLAKQRGRGNRE